MMDADRQFEQIQTAWSKYLACVEELDDHLSDQDADDGDLLLFADCIGLMDDFDDALYALLGRNVQLHWKTPYECVVNNVLVLTRDMQH